MEQDQKVQYQNQIEKYINDKRLPDLFEKYMKELIIAQPEDPIQYLIQLITKRKHYRWIFLSGGTQKVRGDIANTISQHNGLRKVTIQQICMNELKSRKTLDIRNLPDNVVNEAVMKEIRLIDKSISGAIFSGFPCNMQQAMYIQRSGIIPERIFILDLSQDDLVKAYKEDSYKDDNEQSEMAAQREKIELQEVKKAFQGYFDLVEYTKLGREPSIDLCKNILQFRDRRPMPLRSPKIVLIRPPHIREVGQSVGRMTEASFGFTNVCLTELIDEEINQQTELGKYIEAATRRGQRIPCDILTSIVRTQIDNTATKHKGWILQGFPENKDQFNAFDYYQIQPHLVLILDDQEEVLLDYYKKLVKDPITGQYYIPHEVTNAIVQARLVQTTEDEEFWKKIVAEYKELVREAEIYFGVDRAQKFKIKQEGMDQTIVQSIDVLVKNPQIYN